MSVVTAEPLVRPPAERIARLRDCYAQLRQALATVVVGQDEVLKQLATGLVCNGHMVMVGVPGLAKTLMVRALAATLGWDFSRVQFTPDLMPADITGTEILQVDPASQERRMVFRPGPLFAHLVLADEINRTPPKTQAALLEAMQERAVTVGGRTYPLPAPFVVVATQNPIEQEGTYPLPEAQLDRFLLCIQVGYPQREQERAIAARPPRMELPKLPAVASPGEFLEFATIIDQAPISDHVLDYCVDLCTASRPKDAAADDYVRTYVGWGVGPRATQHLVMAAKASAILDGRPAPEVADVRAMAVPVLRHRIVPNYNALGAGIEAAAIVGHLLNTVRER